MQPTCAFEAHANYKGDDYSAVNFTFAASLSRCCAFCKASPGSNMPPLAALLLDAGLPGAALKLSRDTVATCVQPHQLDPRIPQCSFPPDSCLSIIWEASSLTFFILGIPLVLCSQSHSVATPASAAEGLQKW
jgi:hypothetical protein